MVQHVSWDAFLFTAFVKRGSWSCYSQSVINMPFPAVEPSLPGWLWVVFWHHFVWTLETQRIPAVLAINTIVVSPPSFVLFLPYTHQVRCTPYAPKCVIAVRATGSIHTIAVTNCSPHLTTCYHCDHRHWFVVCVLCSHNVQLQV